MTMQPRAARHAGLVALALAVAGACSPDPAQDLGPGSSWAEVRTTTSVATPVDLLLVVDDSASMASRPEVAEATAEMVRRLVAPVCVDDAGVPLGPSARADPLGRCPEGSQPERTPIVDLNVGVITTSLGAGGRADLCADDDGGTGVTRGDGRAHLVARSSPDAADDVPTWEGLGVLAWDPFQARPCPAGRTGRCPGLTDADELVDRARTIVAGVGTTGCGDESPLEAAVRFLVDPAPRIAVGDAALDEALLAHREVFLRPHSAPTTIAPCGATIRGGGSGSTSSTRSSGT